MNLMDGIWGQGRARGYGVTALLAVVVLGAGATAADAVRTAGNEQPAGAVFVPSDAPPAPASSSTPPAPVAAPTTDAVPATVSTVNTPAPEAPAAQPAVVDPQAIGTTDEQGHYTPAPPIVRADEPPVGPPTTPPTVTPLEGEPGYTGPVLEPMPKK